ncbi:DUF2536 family protein [Paenibacillus sp. YYML68]|uniref:DUF2536 family protein n=1 Tax=Paenibacillus sp. YYML68 TaxID=2909250 RepID=UPI00249235F2|nr:DUF2536 family protein [Paenibacillus sp. YYML68]
MDFRLDRIEDKVELYEAYDLKTLQRQIEEQIDNNKALLLRVRSVQHHAVFQPNANKVLYTAVVHYAAAT